MPRPRYLLPSLAVTLALCALAPVPVVAEPDSDRDALRRTVEVVRTVGVAAYTWIAAQEAPPSEGGEPIRDGRIDWSHCPAISHADLASLLDDPTLPATDGWGHALELCLASDDLGRNSYVVGVRSPGRDGALEGTVYEAGPFDPEDFDRDVVWIDGYFVTWPQRAK